MPSCAWSFWLLYMLFLPVFCNSLKHNQIGLQCKVYNGKLDLYVVVNMCKSVADIANLTSFSFTTSRCRVKTTYSYRWLTITIANGFIKVFSRRVKPFWNVILHNKYLSLDWKQVDKIVLTYPALNEIAAIVGLGGLF